jgi:carbon storage regulator
LVSNSALRGYGGGVLIITRRAGERIMLGEDIAIQVMEVSGNQVRLGIEAPKSVPVYREEIWEAVKADKASATPPAADDRT